MKQLFAIFLMVGLVVMPSCKFLKERGILGGKKKKDDIALMLARQDSIRVADSVRNASEKAAAEEAAAAVAQSEAEATPVKADVKVSASANRRFSIVVGSFSNHEYALASSQEYRLKGFSSEIIRSSVTGNELVVIESFDSFRRAVTRTQELRDSSEPEAWLYEER